MLILSRKRNEHIVAHCAGHRIDMCIVEIRGDKVRLGFDAPSYVRIDRAEIDDRRSNYACLPSINVPLPDDQLQRLRERAARQGISITHLASVLIAAAMAFNLDGEQSETTTA